jgi:linoleoyl-CoA desaturase
LSYGEAKSPAFQWTTLVITKIIYFSIWLVLPMLLGITWWKVLLGFVVMHYTAGVILSVVFQLAHVVEDTVNPLPDESGEIENTWASVTGASRNAISGALVGINPYKK